ncbi:hypothetical protein G8D19_06780 [Xanthomonas vesicatoria]|uniref:hypothetical protein n=1 Tax=Xanthomonas vesicatoria TaxID=56460 RepID=UPI0024127F0D|nr:hypothetical protein [Xanthomonas vesicatoria]MDG4488810.1 hypothetical protein [Xanthomonas vesicatoria]
MHWLARVFASAVARRLAYAVVAVALSWCGMSRAYAKDYANQGAAYQGCMADSAAATGRLGGQGAPNCALETPGLYKCYAYQKFNGNNALTLCGASPPADTNHRYALSCKEKPDYNGAFPGSQSGTPVSGSLQCDSGCMKLWTPNGDGTWNGTNQLGEACSPDDNSCSFVPGMHYNANLGMCEPNPPDNCPKGQIKGPNGHCIDNKCPDGMTLQADGTCGPSANECPAGQIKAPSGGCLPGDGQCAAGEVRGPDGTCKKDGNGDGDPDEPGEGDKSQFSGGDNCENPPSCSGDAIMCGQARIQWRIDCNTRKNRNVSGGTCNVTPICTGEKCDAMEYSSMLFQWRTACALERQKAGEGGGESGIKDHMTAMKQAEVNALRGLGADDGHAGVDPNGIWAKDADYGQGKITETLFGSGGGTCDLSFTIGGRLVTPPPQFWRICSIIHWLLVAAAYLWVAFKMGG